MRWRIGGWVEPRPLSISQHFAMKHLGRKEQDTCAESGRAFPEALLERCLLYIVFAKGNTCMSPVCPQLLEAFRPCLSRLGSTWLAPSLRLGTRSMPTARETQGLDRPIAQGCRWFVCVFAWAFTLRNASQPSQGLLDIGLMKFEL